MFLFNLIDLYYGFELTFLILKSVFCKCPLFIFLLKNIQIELT